MTLSDFRKTSLTLCVTAALAISSSQVSAEDADDGLGDLSLEDLVRITVTATKRATSLEKTGMAISVVSEDKLKELGAENFEDYMRTLPGINFTQGLAPGEQNIVMRGVNFPSNRFMLPTVGVYLDEIALSQNGRNPDLNLIDINRIEVLRGPQGTLYGASSMGGTIRYISNTPDSEFYTGKFEAGLQDTKEGDLGYKASAVVNVPIVEDKLAARIVAYYRDKGGWIDNVGYVHTGDYEMLDASLARDDYNSEETTGGRLAIRWHANDDLTVDFAHIYHDTEVAGLNDWNPNLVDSGNNGQGYGQYKAAARVKETYSDQVNTTSLTLDYDSAWANVLWISTYTDRDYKRVEDLSRERHGLDWWVGDFTDAFDYDTDSLVDLNDNVQHAYNLRPINWQLWTHELRFVGKDTKQLHWVAGGYWSDADNRWIQSENYPGAGEQYAPLVPFDVPWFYQPSYEGAANGDFLPDQNPAELYGRYGTDTWFYSDREESIDQLALYANLTYEFNDSWDMTFGMRWFDVDIKNDITLSGIFAGSEALIAQAQFENGQITEQQFVDIVTEAAARNYLTNTQRTQAETGTQFMLSSSYDIDDNKMMYFTWAEGFRVGGVNRSIPTRDGSQLPENFDSDQLVSYEFGFKSLLVDKTLQLNASIYRIDWQDIQLGLTEPTTSFDYNVNAGEATIDGVELELRYRPIKTLEITSSMTFLDHEITDVADFAVASGFSGQKGDPLIGVTDENFYLGIRYAFEVADADTYVRADWTRTGDYITRYDGDDNAHIDSYSILNLGYGMMWDNWELGLFINNATDNDAVVSQALERVSFNYGADGDQGRVITLRPRTIGITATYSF